MSYDPRQLWPSALLGAGIGYVAARGLPYGRRQDLIGIGSPGTQVAPGPTVPPGVDARKWGRARTGLLVYGIVGPNGERLVDPLGESVTSQHELTRWLRDSRIPLYRAEALAAAATIPVMYRGKMLPPRSKVPRASDVLIHEQEISKVFWSRAPAAMKSRPVPLTSALASVFTEFRVGYRVGNPRNLLGTSTKIIKGETLKILTRVMYMSPADEAGINTCAKAGSCFNVCLGWSTGQMTFDTSKQSRVGKTLYWFFDKPAFLTRLDKEIKATTRKAKRENLKSAAIRLNGSSDVRWEFGGQGASDGGLLPSGQTIIEANPSTPFYDYSKYPLKARRCRINGGPPNYHVVYSFDEKKEALANSYEYLRAGGNAAVVVGGRMDDAAYKELKALNDEIARITGDSDGACALPDGLGEMTSPEVHAMQLRQRMGEVATAYNINKNTAKAAAFHVLWPGEQYSDHPTAATDPKLWLKMRDETIRKAKGRFDDNVLGRALFAYEKKIDKKKGLAWKDHSPREWIFGASVVDADQTDIRFLDPPGTWNVLYAKGPAAWDVSGFVVRVDEDGVPYFLDSQEAERRRLEGQPARRMGRANRRGYRAPRPNYYRYRR